MRLLVGLRKRRPPEDQATEPDSKVVIPAEVNRRLNRASLPPLIDDLRIFGKGSPGVTRENDFTWVVRDEKGRIIGGARAHADFSPALLDVEIDRNHRRQGWATRLYAEIASAGIDVEAASDRSLAEGMMTPLGYAFQVRRRAKKF